MRKLPVFAVVREVYAFLWRELWTILRLSWFPVLVMTVIQLFAMRAMFDSVRAVLQSPPAIGDPMSVIPHIPALWEGVNWIVTLAATAMVAVALHRVILFGDRKEGRYIHFALGKTELLFILLPVAVMAAWFAFLAIAVGTAMVAGALSVLFSLIVGAAFAFIIVRFCIIFPIIVVERRYDFGQAWALTGGNFWRLVGAWIVAFIPLAIAFWILALVFLPALLPMLVPPGAAGPADFLERVWYPMMVRMAVVNFPASILAGAIGVGLLSYSYKALSGRAPDEILTPATA